MKVSLMLLAALLLAPLAAAQPSLQGQLTATAVTGSVAPQVNGRGVFLGFFQGPDQPDVGWSLQGNSLLVDLSTYTVSTVTPAYAKESEPQHAMQSYTLATVEPTLSTKPAANAHEFWMMVTPLRSDPQSGFRVAGALPTGELQPLGEAYYINDANHPAPRSSASAPQDGSGVVNVRYRSVQPVLEWKPGGASGAWTVRGDFVLTVYQTDFQVTGKDGQSDHYSTGDDDPGFTLAKPAYDYKETRADLTVHGGVLTLLPNGRSLQVDFAELAAAAHGALDFVNARGSLALPSGEHPLAGQVHLEADDVRLDLAPRGDLVETRFSGTVSSVAVDGRAVPLPASTLISPKASQGLLLGSLAAFAAVSIAFTVLAVRKKTDQALLLARAQAFFEVGRHRAALRASRRLLRLHPGSVDATTLAAMSLVRLGRSGEAKLLLERGLASGAEHQGLLCMVEALVLFHQGNPRLAAQRLQEGFNTYPALNNELAAVDLLDQLLLHAADSPSEPSSPLPHVVSP
ncbi:MAG: hypothetical protein ABR586_04920 [Thermoplasmatota archaeon]